MPLGVRRNMVMPSPLSSSFMARLKLGCAVKSISAALVMELVSATITAYLRCKRFIAAASFIHWRFLPSGAKVWPGRKQGSRFLSARLPASSVLPGQSSIWPLYRRIQAYRIWSAHRRPARQLCQGLRFPLCIRAQARLRNISAHKARIRIERGNYF